MSAAWERYAIDGYDEDNCWLVFFRDLEPEKDDLAWVEPTAGTTHMRVRYAGLLLEPIAPGRTRVVNIANLDAQVPLVTPKVLNWLGRLECTRTPSAGIAWHPLCSPVPAVPGAA